MAWPAHALKTPAGVVIASRLISDVWIRTGTIVQTDTTRSTFVVVIRAAGIVWLANSVEAGQAARAVIFRIRSGIGVPALTCAIGNPAGTTIAIGISSISFRHACPIAIADHRQAAFSKWIISCLNVDAPPILIAAGQIARRAERTVVVQEAASRRDGARGATNRNALFIDALFSRIDAECGAASSTRDVPADSRFATDRIAGEDSAAADIAGGIGVTESIAAVSSRSATVSGDVAFATYAVVAPAVCPLILIARSFFGRALIRTDSIGLARADGAFVATVTIAMMWLTGSFMASQAAAAFVVWIGP